MIHSKSKPGISAEVDIFSLPPTNTSIDLSLYQEFKPLNSIQDIRSKYEFRILPSPSHYLDFEDSFLFLKMKVVQSDGSDYDASAECSVCNNILHSMFNQIEITSNGQPLETVNNYAYRAYFETLFKDAEMSKGEKNSLIFHLDTDKFKNANSNAGYQYRKHFISESKEVELCGRLFFDIAFQNRFILNNMPLSIMLTRNADNFCIVTPTDSLNAKLQVTDLSFIIRRHCLFPSITIAHQKLLESGHDAKYPLIHSSVKCFTIPKGNQIFLEDDVFLGSVPARCFIAMVSNSSFIGDKKKNPFFFGHFNISSLGLYVNNIPIPTHPMTFDFASSQTLLGYFHVDKCVQKMNKGRGISFSSTDYKEGYTIFAFDIAPLDLTGPGALYLEKSGSVKICLKFSSPISEAVTLLVFSEHQRVLEINKLRQVAVQ